MTEFTDHRTDRVSATDPTQRRPGERRDDGPAATISKPRDQHRGLSAPHLGLGHHEKDALERAAREVDEGPIFGSQGAPPQPDLDSLTEIKQAFDDFGREVNVSRSG